MNFAGGRFGFALSGQHYYTFALRQIANARQPGTPKEPQSGRHTETERSQPQIRILYRYRQKSTPCHMEAHAFEGDYKARLEQLLGSLISLTRPGDHVDTRLFLFLSESGYSNGGYKPHSGQFTSCKQLICSKRSIAFPSAYGS